MKLSALPDPGVSGFGYDFVFDHSHLVDFQPDPVARLQPFRRRERGPDTCGRSAEDEIAGLQRERGGEMGDLGRDVMDHVADMTRLAQLAIHIAA